MASGAPQPPPPQGSLRLPAPLKPLPGHPFDANTKLPPPGGPPPPQWAQRPPSENNGGPSSGSSPPNGELPSSWSPATDAFPPQHGRAKPFIFQLESSHVAFAASYLQSIAFDHYTVLLQFNPNSLVLSNWQAFAQEFLSKFGVFDIVAEAEENLFNLQMHNNEEFTTFIIRFEKEAYKTGWNDNTLQFALHCALPQCIKDVLRLAPKQPSYNSYKALVTQINQCQQQDLQLLMTHLHVSAPLILGLPWLCSTNPHIDWQSLTLHFDCHTLKHLEPIPFDVSTPVSATDHPHTPPQLCLKSAQSFVLNAQLSKFPQVLTTLINSKATGMFVSDQLDFTHDSLDRLMELQLFDSKPTTAGPITKTHSNSIVLDNGLWFLVDFLVIQLLEVTLIVLGLPWLCDINPDINWRDLTMKFSRFCACLATVHLHLQPTNNPSKARATNALTASLNNFGNPPPPQYAQGTPPAFPSNIPGNKYKGPNYPPLALGQPQTPTT
ncbi:hypothetical protein C0993_003346 [Termitomyces sp. T159_Od127]|nr:hypothetical protein C0993_003346 [Termitomyces sp. T159_Od127]